MQRGISEGGAAGGGIAGQDQPGDAVLQAGWQGERGIAGGVENLPGEDDAGGGFREHGLLAGIGNGVHDKAAIGFKRRWAEQRRQSEGLEDAGRMKRPQEGGKIIAAGAVGKIEARAFRRAAQKGGGGRPVAGPGLRLQVGKMPGRRGGVGDIGQSQRCVGGIPCGGEQGDAAILRLGGGDYPLRSSNELWPGGGGGPAIVDDQQHRAAAGQDRGRA
jgi:hypothetical protein